MPIQLYYFWDGKNMNYGDSFVMTYSQNILILSGIVILLAIILMIVKKCTRSKKQYNSLLSTNPNNHNNICRKIMEITIITLIWLSIISVSLIFPLSSSFSIIPLWVAMYLIFALYLIAFTIQIWRQSSRQTTMYRIIINNKYLLGAQLLIMVLLSIFLPLFLDKGCLCVYSSGYGFDVLPQLQYSTNWIRALQLPSQICDPNQVCHLYATLPENAMNEVFINVQTGINIKDIKLQIGIQKLQCQSFQFPSKIEYRGQRNLFTCYAKQLQPNTVYPIIIINSDGKYLKESNYQTPPLQQDLKLFFGGDFGYQTAGIDIVRTLTQVNPHVILIGGDVAYDNGNPNCYYSWDLFLNIFEEQFTFMGRIIPFIFSVGNHDVGYNEYANFNVTVSEENGPLYFSYFPQRANQNGEIESIENRVTFNVHILHKLAIYGLDSGYLYPHNATQLDWLKEKSAQYQDLRKIAHYHVPMYPTCFSNSSFMTKWDKIKFSQEIWVPVFDQYEFKAAFENHVHQYKRSYPLKNNVRAEGGTVYFGDGSMGVVAEKCPEYAQTYQKGRPFEGLFQEVRTEHSEHFWVMVSGEEQLDFIAYTPEYKVIQGSQYEIKNDL